MMLHELLHYSLVLFCLFMCFVPSLQLQQTPPLKESASFGTQIVGLDYHYVE